MIPRSTQLHGAGDAATERLAANGGRRSRRDILRAGAMLPLGAALLAACGGTQAATGSASTSAARSVSSAGTASATTAVAASPTKAPTTASSSAAAAANAPKPTPTPAAGETHKGAATTIDLWYGWGGATAIQTWNTVNTKMATALPSFNVHWLTANNNTKLLTAIAGGDPPNVAVGNAPYPEFWARGAAIALDDHVAMSKVDGVALKSDIAEPFWEYASYKGKTYGVPAMSAFVVLALCLDMTNLQKLNIDPTKLSWDWETLTQMQQQLTTKAPNGGIAVLGIDPLDAMGGGFGGGNPFYWGQAWGLEYFDQNTGKFDFDNEQLVDAMTTVKKIHDIAGGAQAVADLHKSYGTWTESPTAAFPSGVEDMNINGYWAPGELAHSSPSREFAYTWAPVPTSRKGVKFQSTGSHNAFIPKGAKNTDDAFQLIEFLVSDAVEAVVFSGQGWLGARRSYLDKVDTSKYKGLDFFVNSYKSNDKLYGMPANPIENFTATHWNTALNNFLHGKAQPKDALQQLQQQVTDQMQQQFPNG